MANSEWVVGVHVQHFQYLYNVEYRSTGKYCCCTMSYLEVPCGANLAELNVTACTSGCQPYFEMHLEVCFADGKCPTMKTETDVVENILSISISPLLVQLYLTESMINITDVSAKQTNIKVYK